MPSEILRGLNTEVSGTKLILKDQGHSIIKSRNPVERKSEVSETGFSHLYRKVASSNTSRLEAHAGFLDCI